jgi:hypothetical protein
MAAHEHRNAVRDQHTKRRNETQTRQSGYSVAMSKACHSAELHLIAAHPYHRPCVGEKGTSMQIGRRKIGLCYLRRQLGAR